MRVLIPQPLRPYTNAKEVEGEGATLAALLTDIDRRYPGFKFRMVDEQDRIRRHIRVFVDGQQTFDLNMPLTPSSAVHIVQALSGG
jgi:sulfur-carrier protein